MVGDKLLFVDSNYFVALFNPADSLARQAEKIAKHLDAADIRLVTSNLVFLEVVTVLAQRRSRAVAVEVGAYLLSHVNIVHVDESSHQDAWSIFQIVPSKNVSFVDCSILAILRAENIHSLLTFDITDFHKFRKQFRFEIFGEA